MEHFVMLKENSYRILSTGASIIDLTIPVTEEFLAQIGIKKGGANVIDKASFDHVLKTCGQTPAASIGGSSANVIKGLAGLGEKCAFLSYVGADPYGEYYIDYMKKLGVIGLYCKSTDLHTTTCLCMITPDGERTMRFLNGCATEITEEMLNPNYFHGIQLAHFGAYSLKKANLVEESMKCAYNENAAITLDLSSFEVVQKYKNKLLQLISTYVDIVFGNEEEMRSLTGLDAKESALKLQEICPIVVVLLGEEGCLIGHGGTVQHVPTVSAQVVDTTGAGDYFASGFIYRFLRNYSLVECAKLGHRLAHCVVEVQGADLPIEKWEELRESCC